MSVYYLSVILGIINGLFLSYSFIWLSRFREYMESAAIRSKWMKFADAVWRILLPIIFVAIIIVPVELLYFFLDDNTLLKKMTHVYSYSFFGTYFIFIFIFITIGKIKIK
jgi:hypothetical protein